MVIAPLFHMKIYWAPFFNRVITLSTAHVISGFLKESDIHELINPIPIKGWRKSRQDCKLAVDSRGEIGTIN
jgi:hypothetical protein